MFRTWRRTRPATTRHGFPSKASGIPLNYRGRCSAANAPVVAADLQVFVVLTNDVAVNGFAVDAETMSRGLRKTWPYSLVGLLRRCLKIPLVAQSCLKKGQTQFQNLGRGFRRLGLILVSIDVVELRGSGARSKAALNDGKPGFFEGPDSWVCFSEEL
jgi:hypothetical protein